MASESGAPLFQSESTSQGADVPLRNDTPLGEPEGPPTGFSIPQPTRGVNPRGPLKKQRADDVFFAMGIKRRGHKANFVTTWRRWRDSNSRAGLSRPTAFRGA